MHGAESHSGLCGRTIVVLTVCCQCGGPPLKILVIEAAGKSGQAVVEQAIAGGHQVTAFVRRAGEATFPGVHVVEGDATSPAEMDAAILGQDAVLDTIGGKTPWKSTSLESTVACNVIDSMQRHGVRRLVVISMIGEGDSEANVPMYERLLLSTLLRGADKDKSEMESAVRSSDLEWIILRPAILTEGVAKGHVKVFQAESTEKAHTITRADLAAFMIEQLSTDKYLHQTVTIANS